MKVRTVLQVVQSADDVILRVRPKWKRVLLVPRLLRVYRAAGLSWWPSVALAWVVVTYDSPCS